jgi:DNA-binding transcriptional MerR regulator
MASQQASLFDFFEEPTPKKVQVKKAIAQPEPIPEPEIIVVNEEPVEVDFEPVPKVEEKISLQKHETDIFQKLEPTKSTRGRKKLSEVSITADLIDIPDDDVLFQKKYYSIGIVAEMFKVNISHIRFWEKEFDILKPKLNGKGDRHFRPEDVKNLKLIHHLVKEKKYTIEGAKDFLKKNKKVDEVFAVIEELKRTKLFLTELKLSL